jgi:hypothetical protein
VFTLIFAMLCNPMDGEFGVRLGTSGQGINRGMATCKGTRAASMADR